MAIYYRALSSSFHSYFFLVFNLAMFVPGAMATEFMLRESFYNKRFGLVNTGNEIRSQKEKRIKEKL